MKNCEVVMQLLSRPLKKADKEEEGTGGRAAASEVTRSAGPHTNTLLSASRMRHSAALGDPSQT